MIVVKEIQLNRFRNTAFVKAYADTKSEVLADATIEGLPDGITIEEGSALYTANLEVAIMQSNGQWKWS